MSISDFLLRRIPGRFALHRATPWMAVRFSAWMLAIGLLHGWSTVPTPSHVLGLLPASWRTILPGFVPGILPSVLPVMPKLAAGGLFAAEPNPPRRAGRLWVLTDRQGAALPADAECDEFPVLVRLHRDFFPFAEARVDGSDVAFSDADGKTLVSQVDHWDTARGEAAIWVRVPKLRGDSRQMLQIAWGGSGGSPPAAPATPAAPALPANPSSPAKPGLPATPRTPPLPRVFDRGNGYLGVWHLESDCEDAVGTFLGQDQGTVATAGVIGAARHFPGGRGVFCGDKLETLPTADEPHSTEAWFRPRVPNATLIGWGNEGGGRGSKIRMQLRSPPHIHIDSDFSDVFGEQIVTLGEWTHVVHTYDKDGAKVYINGKLDGAARPRMDIKRPGRLWLGGWYHHYDYVGDLDEVRISHVSRSSAWVKAQYENQKPQQTLVGWIVPPGDSFAVTPSSATIAEGRSLRFSAQAGGALKVHWTLVRGGDERVIATDRLTCAVEAGRVASTESVSLRFTAVYPDGPKTVSVPIRIEEAIPEPKVSLEAPANWDGRTPITIVPRIENLAELKAAESAGAVGAATPNFHWTLEGVAATRLAEANGSLRLTRAHQSGALKVAVAASNGGAPMRTAASITVREPVRDEWSRRPDLDGEMPVDGQFLAREDGDEGRLRCAGKIAEAPLGTRVELRVFADGQPYRTIAGPLAADGQYKLEVRVRAGLVKYRVELAMLEPVAKGDARIIHRADDIVCGDVFLITGQSNAEATDVGPEDPSDRSPWIRSFGSAGGSPAAARDTSWRLAVIRDRQGGRGQIGAWGMEMAQQLVERRQIPVCVLNGAVGGSRIDQHQRREADPVDLESIYGRLLWRTRQAGLAHGVRAVFWHQGENDQGADGPSGGFGWETYRELFVALATAWKQDYPNLQRMFAFQIWPRACSMGRNGSDNQLREVQRRLPEAFSRLSVMSTLGIKPPGGCHYPLAGYRELGRQIAPLVERDLYQVAFARSVAAPNLVGVRFATPARDQLVLEFDQPMLWADTLAKELRLDGQPGQVQSGEAKGRIVALKLLGPANAKRISYLDSATWNPDNLLVGENGLAALTFWEVPIGLPVQER
ncbi:MAG: hypothetical protein RLY70_11 [Planctomycetota bacterium]